MSVGNSDQMRLQKGNFDQRTNYWFWFSFILASCEHVLALITNIRNSVIVEEKPNITNPISWEAEIVQMQQLHRTRIFFMLTKVSSLLWGFYEILTPLSNSIVHGQVFHTFPSTHSLVTFIHLSNMTYLRYQCMTRKPICERAFHISRSDWSTHI